LLPSRAISPGVATLTVIAERAVSRVSLRLVAITALRLSLALIEVARVIPSTSIRWLARTTFGLPVSSLDRLVRLLARSILPLESRSVLLIEVRLSRAALLPEICRIFISKLLLVPLLVKLWRAAVIVEVVRAVIGIIQLAAVYVVCVEIVPIDVVRVDVVAINVVEIGVVQVRVIDISVVAITVCEGV